MRRIATAACLLIMVFACGKSDVRIVRVVDRENMSMVLLAGKDAELQEIYDADFVIVGGSLSGLTAAFATCSAGRKTILIEETEQLAACFADTNSFYDNRFIDSTGSSERVKKFRGYIRDWYRSSNRPQPRIQSPAFSKLADFGNDSFCFETDAALAAVDSVLASYQERGRLIVLTRHKVAEVITYGRRVQSVNVVDLDNHLVHQVRGWMFIDATETGELIPMAGIDFTLGIDLSDADTTNTDNTAFYDTYYYRDEIAGKKSGDIVVPLLKNKPEGNVPVKSVSFALVPRLIKGYDSVRPNDITASSQQGPRAAFIRDSVGIGYSPIIRRGKAPGDSTIIQTRPFQIPLGAMIPPEYTNFIAGGPSIGVDRMVASAYQAPSVRMAVGEAAGVVSEFCAGKNISTHDILNDPERLELLHDHMVRRRNVPIYWYDNIAPGDSAFVDAQMMPFRNPSFDKSQNSLSYRPSR